MGIVTSWCTSKAVPPVVVPPKKARKKPIPQSLRHRVWINEYGPDAGWGPCPCCQSRLHFSQFHAAHVVSEANGGATTEANLRPTCAGCNLSMGTQNMTDFIALYYPPSGRARAV